jgi:hypothetical protein
MTDEGQHEWVQPAAFTYGFEPAAAALPLCSRCGVSLAGAFCATCGQSATDIAPAGRAGPSGSRRVSRPPALTNGTTAIGALVIAVLVAVGAIVAFGGTGSTKAADATPAATSPQQAALVSTVPTSPPTVTPPTVTPPTATPAAVAALSAAASAVASALQAPASSSAATSAPLIDDTIVAPALDDQDVCTAALNDTADIFNQMVDAITNGGEVADGHLIGADIADLQTTASETSDPALSSDVLGVASAAETVRSVMIDGGDMSTFDTDSDSPVDTTATALSNSCAAAVDPLGNS